MRLPWPPYADMRLTIREIEVAFGFSEIDLPRCIWDSYMDVERQAHLESLDNTRRPSARRRTNSFMDVADEEQRAEDLRTVAKRLAEEFENGPQFDDEVVAVAVEDDSGSSIHGGAATTARHSTTTPSHPATTLAHTPTTPRRAEAQLNEDEKHEADKSFKDRAMRERGPKALCSDFALFREVQHELITKALTGGTLTDCSSRIQLKVHSPQPSVLELYGHDWIRGKAEEARRKSMMSAATTPGTTTPTTATVRRRRVRLQGINDEEDDDGSTSSDDEGGARRRAPPGTFDTIIAGDHSLIRIYSMMFALR